MFATGVAVLTKRTLAGEKVSLPAILFNSVPLLQRWYSRLCHKQLSLYRLHEIVRSSPISIFAAGQTHLVDHFADKREKSLS
jgi:hypothetical protein